MCFLTLQALDSCMFVVSATEVFGNVNIFPSFLNCVYITM